MPLALAIGAGVGLIKSEFVDAPRAERQRKLAAATQRYSPWTGLQAQPVQEADPVGSALTFGATGAQLASGYKNSQAQQKLMDAQASWLDKNPYNFGTSSNLVSKTPTLGNFGQGNAANPYSYWGLQGF